MYEGKLGTDKWFPVILLDDTDFKTPETGKAYDDVTVKYHTEGASSQSTYTVGSGNWSEAGAGEYWLQMGGEEFTAEAKYQVEIACSGCLTHRFVVEVRDKTIAELIDNVDTLLTRLPSALNIASGVVESNVKQIDGQLTAGNNATLNLKQLNVVNNAGDAIIASSTGGNGNGIKSSGNGTGKGIDSTGGATGHGIHSKGGSTSGYGVYAEAVTSGDGIRAKGTLGHGMNCIGNDYSAGINLLAGANGNGLQSQGGASSGHGFYLEAGNNGNGMECRGAANGHGIRANGQGSGEGIYAVGGATGNGIEAAGLGGGYDIQANIQGNVSGSIGSLAAQAKLDVNAEVDTALADIGLDHLISAAVAGSDVADNSIIAQIVSKSATADWDTFDNTTDSLEGISDAASGGDWTSGEKEQIRDALGVDGTKTAATGGQLQTIDSNVDAVLVDTNEIQGKLPTNYIMGSSVASDKDDEIDAILVDTNEIQGKLPTNYIMGSSVASDKDDEIDSIKSTVDTNLDAAISSRSTFDHTTDQVTVATNNDKTAYNLAADQSAVTIGTVNALGTQAKADVNAEVVDVITVDTVSELTVGTPPVTDSVMNMLLRLYMAFRNKGTQTKGAGAFKTFHDSSDNAITKKATADDGSTYTESEMISAV